MRRSAATLWLGPLGARLGRLNMASLASLSARLGPAPSGCPDGLHGHRAGGALALAARCGMSG